MGFLPWRSTTDGCGRHRPLCVMAAPGAVLAPIAVAALIAVAAPGAAAA
ncbi:hypothetical protein ACIG87_24560 [Micromonospora sp. NPDC051925]